MIYLLALVLLACGAGPAPTAGPEDDAPGDTMACAAYCLCEISPGVYGCPDPQPPRPPKYLGLDILPAMPDNRGHDQDLPFLRQ